MDMSYLASSFYRLVALGCGLYLIFYLSFRRAIVSISDPLNYGGLLAAFYLAGALILPSLREVNRSYAYLIILTILYFVVGAFFSRNRALLSAPRLGVKKSHQILFTTALTGLLVVNVIVNQIFGVIPLLQGTQARADYSSVASPTLFFLAPDIGQVVLFVFLLTEIKSVRILAGIGVAASLVYALLGGSKSGLFSVLFILCAADFILNLKRKSSQSKIEILQLTRRIRSIRRVGILCSLGIAILLPAYLSLIGVTSGGGAGTGLETLATRLFGGFDGLAIIVSQNIDITAVHGVNISGFYFYPFLKKFSLTPEFQSAGSYLIYELTGSYQLATSGMNPNSNLSIELLLSNGSIALSSLIIFITAAIIFKVRSSLLRLGHLRILDLVLWALVVFGPFSILLDGAYFVIRLYELIGLYMVLNALVNFVAWLDSGRPVFKML